MKEELFKRLAEEHYNKIFRICYRYFGDHEEARDACQETFLRIWLNLNKFRGEASPVTWACRIAINVCMTYLKKNNKHRSSIEKGPAVTSCENMADETYDTENEDAKLMFFNQYLSKLTSADRTLVALYLEELDSSEIASVTGLSEANVRTRIHRIKNEIKKGWEGNHGTR
jgi:RNA polymerase sigma-70 factor (ECF subfamily)